MRSNTEVKPTLQKVGEFTSHDCTQWVVGHIALDIFQHTRALDDAIVIAIFEEGATGGTRR